MISSETRNKYSATIGIECHVQLNTKTKLFAGVDNDARLAPVNTLISHICLGMPGSLPVLNQRAVELAVRAAYALGTKPQLFSKFDRKHYFYPDLPKGYQITQFDQPIILGGSIEIDIDGEKKAVGITRAHLEEDAGKNTHPVGAAYSLVDLNRAGTPLLEIVSEPDMHSSKEAKAYAQELYLRMKYADVSDCNLFYGNMRLDVNVSVSKCETLGTRTETKNLNSFRSIEKAVDYEIKRQIELLEKGESVIQETLGWDDAKQKTTSQRSKEESHDYRYFPEPDVPPVVLQETFCNEVAASLPTMPDEWRKTLASFGLDKSQTDILLLSEVDHDSVNYLSLLRAYEADASKARQVANWFVNIEIPTRNADPSKCILREEERAGLYEELYLLVGAQKLSSTNAKLLIGELLSHPALPENIEKYAAEQGFIQVSDNKEMKNIVQKVLDENQQAVEDIKSGEMKAIGYLVGQVMKQSMGKANPERAQQIIRELLELS
ncbi:MAG TPA: Asp-tRNA(Asn)/Glu-tRNA(Gln) amidotransferase subunit GatB [Candidatus Saccharibacteria bacterium]|nr:Asp-tRNA(Asn)/Glu-tRNA(Gln) amidotransferase subunit GatB [Candidatus Saccharibacteria bacterium]